MITRYVDPPEGWRYGFPKVLPNDWQDHYETLHAWMLANGYPEELLAGLSLRYCRIWKKEDKLETPVETVENKNAEES